MIDFIKKWLSCLFCNHTACKFIRNIGGDEQMYHYVKGGGLAKSEWVCCDCDCLVYRSYRIKDK